MHLNVCLISWNDVCWYVWIRLRPWCFFLLHIICLGIFHAYVPLILYIMILILLVLFCVFLFLFLSFVSCFMEHKRKSTPSQNLLRSGASSSYSPTNSTPSHIRLSDDKARKDFLENFSRWGIHSKRQGVLSNFSDTNLPTVIYSRGWESLCGISVTCPFVIIQNFYFNMHGFDYKVPHFITCVWGTHMVVTPDLISEVLHIPRVEFTDYPNCEHLRTVSKDELSSRFWETPSSWGNRQNTHCLGFAKGLRFLNMVMTFILHPLSHYNSITEPRTWFLLSLLEGISIDFPSHFILSLIDVYRDTMSCDKLIFPLAIK